MNSYISNFKEVKLLRRRITGFTLLTLALLSIISLVYKLVVINTICDSRYFTLPADTRTVILGNSYLMTGLIPEMFPNTLNGAKRAEILPFACQKIRFICDNNPQVKNVIISLSYFSLTKAREEAMRSSESVQYFCDSYFMLYDDKLKKVTYTPETSYFISWLKYTMGVPFEVSKELGHYLRIISGNMHYQYYPFWGGFQIVPALDKGVQLEERIAAHFDLSGAEIELSNILIDYFDRINKYCNERGIRLITVNTPKIEGYDKMVPEGYKTALEKVVNEMEFKYKNYLYLDYSRAEMELKYMRDADHLNYEGAKLFSHELYNDIESILIEGADYDN